MRTSIGRPGSQTTKRKRRASLEGLVVSFVRPRRPQMFVCAGGRFVLCPAGSGYVFFAAFLVPPPFFEAFLVPPFFAAFFPPFLVAIASMCSFFRVWFFVSSRPQDTVLTSLLWARVNGAQHLAI